MKLEQVPNLESFEVLIVGLVRNCETSLESEVETLRASFDDFKSIREMLKQENNSADDETE